METYFDRLKLWYITLKSLLTGDGTKEEALLRLEICRFLLEHVQDPQQEIEQHLTQVTKFKDLKTKVELIKAQMYFSSGKSGLAKQILVSCFKEAVA